MPNRAVFLDRDGVLNRAPVIDGGPQSPASLAELELLPGVAEACALLQAAGFRLIGTFQSIGFKHGRWLDTVLMQRQLGSGDTTPP